MSVGARWTPFIRFMALNCIRLPYQHTHNHHHHQTQPPTTYRMSNILKLLHLSTDNNGGAGWAVQAGGQGVLPGSSLHWILIVLFNDLIFRGATRNSSASSKSGSSPSLSSFFKCTSFSSTSQRIKPTSCVRNIRMAPWQISWSSCFNHLDHYY